MLVDAGLQIGEGLAVGALLLGKVVDNLSQNSDALKKSVSIAASLATGDFVGAMQKMMPEAAGGGEQKSGFFDNLIAEVNKVRDSFKKPEGGLNTVDTGINKLTQAPSMIADSLAKVGGGGGVFSSAANDIDIQRDQLRMQTRMATAIEAFVQKFQPDSNPYIGITMDASTAA